MATGIAVRPDTEEVYVTGWTRSPDFLTANAIDAVFGDDPRALSEPSDKPQLGWIRAV